MSNSLQPHGLYSPWTSPGQNTGVGRLSLIQEVFPTQGSNPGLLQCCWILYQLSYKGSPRTLEWVVYPFSSWSSWPGIEPGSPAWQADSLPTEISGKLSSSPFKLGQYLTLRVTLNGQMIIIDKQWSKQKKMSLSTISEGKAILSSWSLLSRLFSSENLLPLVIQLLQLIFQYVQPLFLS